MIVFFSPFLTFEADEPDVIYISIFAIESRPFFINGFILVERSKRSSLL